jgi:phosphatidylglycerol phospholipase C
MKHLPCFPITHIGFSTSYARQFLKVPGVSFNMLRKIMVGPFGNRFLRDVKKANRSIFVWTVNDEAWMKWAISKEFDGVLTDDPKKYLEVRDSYVAKKHRIPLKSWGAVFFMNILAFVFSLLFRYRYGFSIKASAIRASLDSENVVPVRRQWNKVMNCVSFTMIKFFSDIQKNHA